MSTTLALTLVSVFYIVNIKRIVNINCCSYSNIQLERSYTLNKLFAACHI